MLSLSVARRSPRQSTQTWQGNWRARGPSCETPVLRQPACTRDLSVGGAEHGMQHTRPGSRKTRNLHCSDAINASKRQSRHLVYDCLCRTSGNSGHHNLVKTASGGVHSNGAARHYLAGHSNCQQFCGAHFALLAAHPLHGFNKLQDYAARCYDWRHHSFC